MRRVGIFLARRVALGIFTVLALIAITFAVYWALPTAPTSFLYSSQHFTDYQIAHTNHLLGLDRPKIVQYGDYVWRLLHGDLGHAWNGSRLVNNTELQQQAVAPVVFNELGVTLSIIIGGAFLVVLLALPLGTFTGTRVGSFGDRAVSWATLVGICTHPLVLGALLSLYFGFNHLNWLPGGGYCPLGGLPQSTVPGAPPGCDGVHDWALHLILPWITFALLFIALYTRMVRASVADTLHEDFVRTARAKGASEARVLRSHVLPSASLRVLTMVGMEIGTAIGVCIYIETAFGMFGLGKQAVFSMGVSFGGMDLPMMLAIVTLITLIVVIGNLIVDALYILLDPRAGRETARSGAKSPVGGVF
ncbi:MAG: ABC transporter permease [Gaiellaceae bacterium]